MPSPETGSVGCGLGCVVVGEFVVELPPPSHAIKPSSKSVTTDTRLITISPQSAAFPPPFLPLIFSILNRVLYLSSERTGYIQQTSLRRV